MEIIQVLYRGRGNFRDGTQGVWRNLDNTDKHLIFYLASQAIYYTDDEAGPKLSLQENLLNLINILLILKTALITRIRGSGRIGQDEVTIIPIGGKAISAAGETFTSRMAVLIEELKKEHYKRNLSDRGLRTLYERLEELLGAAQIDLTRHSKAQADEQVYRSYLSLRKSFTEEFRKATATNFEHLLNFNPPELGYVQGSLLIVPLKNKAVQENYLMRLAQELKSWSKETDNEESLLPRMVAISKSRDYPESLRFAMREALDLIRLLQQNTTRTQWLTQRSQRDDQYYMLPLFTLISPSSLEEYFTGKPQEPEDNSFKELLGRYLWLLYPVEGLLPIGPGYLEFPFVMFRSYSLREARSKVFTDKYLMSSRELNVLNLILAREPEPNNPTGTP